VADDKVVIKTEMSRVEIDEATRAMGAFAKEAERALGFVRQMAAMRAGGSSSAEAAIAGATTLARTGAGKTQRTAYNAASAAFMEQGAQQAVNVHAGITDDEIRRVQAVGKDRRETQGGSTKDLLPLRTAHVEAQARQTTAQGIVEKWRTINTQSQGRYGTQLQALHENKLRATRDHVAAQREAAFDWSFTKEDVRGMEHDGRMTRLSDLSAVKLDVRNDMERQTTGNLIGRARVLGQEKVDRAYSLGKVRTAFAQETSDIRLAASESLVEKRAAASIELVNRRAEAQEAARAAREEQSLRLRDDAAARKASGGGKGSDNPYGILAVGGALYGGYKAASWAVGKVAGVLNEETDRMIGIEQMQRGAALRGGYRSKQPFLQDRFTKAAADFHGIDGLDFLKQTTAYEKSRGSTRLMSDEGRREVLRAAVFGLDQGVAGSFARRGVRHEYQAGVLTAGLASAGLGGDMLQEAIANAASLNIDRMNKGAAFSARGYVGAFRGLRGAGLEGAHAAAATQGIAQVGMGAAANWDAQMASIAEMTIVADEAKNGGSATDIYGRVKGRKANRNLNTLAGAAAGRDMLSAYMNPEQADKLIANTEHDQKVSGPLAKSADGWWGDLIVNKMDANPRELSRARSQRGRDIDEMGEDSASVVLQEMGQDVKSIATTVAEGSQILATAITNMPQELMKAIAAVNSSFSSSGW